MKLITGQLLKLLPSCDTSNILNLYDTSYAQLNQQNHRTYIKEDILSACKRFNKIVSKYGLPDLEKLTFSIDPQIDANWATLQLLPNPDSSLNLNSCSLIVEFYPDRFFKDNKILKFFVVPYMLNKPDDKISLPSFTPQKAKP